MKIVTPVVWLGSAAALFTVAALQNSFELLFVSVLAGGVGLGTLFPALKQRWSSQPAITEGSPRIQHLEDRLRVTEEELASATRELAELKQQHDFDLKLQLKKAKPPE